MFMEKLIHNMSKWKEKQKAELGTTNAPSTSIPIKTPKDGGFCRGKCNMTINISTVSLSYIT